MRTARAAPLCLTGRGTHGLLQLHRRLLQSHPAALRPRVSLAHLLRTGDANRPTARYPLNRPRKRGNFSPPRCLPLGEGGLIQPEGQVTAPLQASFVGRPILDPIAGLRDAVTASGIVFKRHARARNGPAAAGPPPMARCTNALATKKSGSGNRSAATRSDPPGAEPS